MKKIELPLYFHQSSRRLLFRKITTADVNSCMDFFEDEESLHILNFDFSQSHEKLAYDWIVGEVERYEKIGLGYLAVIDQNSNTFIGICGIIPREIDGKDLFDISYVVKPYYRKKGYGTEMAVQMKEFYKSHRETDGLVSIILNNNDDAIHVAVKNRMKFKRKSNFLYKETYIFGFNEYRYRSGFHERYLFLIIPVILIALVIYVQVERFDDYFWGFLILLEGFYLIVFMVVLVIRYVILQCKKIRDFAFKPLIILSLVLFAFVLVGSLFFF